jgi:hypothetical protein
VSIPLLFDDGDVVPFDVYMDNKFSPMVEGLIKSEVLSITNSTIF